MRTIHCSGPLGGCLPRGCLPGEGVSAQEGCLPSGVVSAQGDGVCPGGLVSAQGGVCPGVSPPRGQNDRWLWKHYSVADGKNIFIWIDLLILTTILQDISFFPKYI